jgi:phospholipid/cholesterol/gamma-HCH transport system substrate-binding protein
MEKEISNNIRLGVFVSIGIVFFIVGLYLIGSNKNMFSKNIKLHSNFKDVNGLIIGNNVRYYGIDIGTVDDIQMLNESSVHVTMIIKDSYKQYIRKNSICTIGTDGLMGNKLINIIGGDKSFAFVVNEDMLNSSMDIDFQSMLKTLDSTNHNFTVTSANIKDITNDIKGGDNLVNALIYDQALEKMLQSTINNMEKTSRSLSHFARNTEVMTNEINNGRGLVHQLIKDTMIVHNLNATIYDLNQTTMNLNSSSIEVNRIIQKASSGNGTISTFVNDTIMSGNIKQSFANLNVSTKSLGEVLEAAKHNFLLRGFFKKQEKLKKQQALDSISVKYKFDS